MTHTPGPWRVKASSGCLHVVSEDGRFQTGCISFDGAGEDNARLIAAAPDLLAALRVLRIDANRLCDRNLGGTYEEDCRRAIAFADAAIAKAEGRL